MAEQPILIDVDFEGGQEAASGIDGVAQKVRDLHDWLNQTAPKVDRVDTNFQRLTQSGQNVAQRIQGASAAAQQLVARFGSDSTSAGMISSVAGAVAQFTAMGAVLGPGGAVVGGVIGLATAIAGLVEESNRVSISIGSTTAGFEAMGRAAREAADEAFGDAALDRGDSFGSTIEEVTDRLAGMEERLREVRRLRVEALFARENEAARLYREEAERLTTAIQNLGTARDRLRGPGTDLGNGFTFRPSSAPTLPTGVDAPTDPNFMRRRGGGGGMSPEEEANRRYLASVAEVAAREREIREQLDEEARKRHEHEIERIAELESARIAAQDHELENQARINEALAEAERDLAERRAEGELARKEAELEMEQRALQARREANEEVLDLAQSTTNAMGKALGDLATGQKTADEAFKGFAASFLEMISQYTSLKAATEFADAAASFARYDYGGGAAHIGAGLAFTAVAVATGVGAAVLNAPPQAPARPETSAQDTGAGRGGDIVINWSSPVVTAGTRAELGREIATMVGEAASI
jgi:hypothetical protein